MRKRLAASLSKTHVQGSEGGFACHSPRLGRTQSGCRRQFGGRVGRNVDASPPGIVCSIRRQFENHQLPGIHQQHGGRPLPESEMLEKHQPNASVASRQFAGYRTASAQNKGIQTSPAASPKNA